MKANKQMRSISARTRKEKEVWEACSHLKSTNKKLTYYAIGEQLIKFGYRRGSNSDIRRYLTTWKQYHNGSSKKNITKSEATLKEHEPLQTAPIHTISHEDQQKLILEFLDISQHYAEQFDRLLKANEFLRKENKILRHKLKELEECH